MFRFLFLFVLLTQACVPHDSDPSYRTHHQYLVPADDFIITVKTDNDGFTSPTEFTIATYVESVYNYDVDCNDDGVNEAVGQSGNYTCDYAQLGGPGTYTIRIKNTFPRPRFDLINAEKIISVEQWGTQQWTSFQNAFKGTTNLSINASDVPDLSLVTDLSGMFWSSGVGRGSGNWNWNTLGVTNLNKMFLRASQFNKDIGQWDVSRVTNMEKLFAAADIFNVDIGRWDVTSVTNMNRTFSAAAEFNKDIGGWNTSTVTNMGGMFQNALEFNQDIGQWDVSKVTTFRDMFRQAKVFNQDIGAWNVSSGTDFFQMFQNTWKFDQDLSAWNMEAATEVYAMLQFTYLSTWNYDAILTGWSAQNLKPNLNFSAWMSNYCTAGAARANIIATHQWMISDSGKKCNVYVELDARNNADSEASGQNLPVLLVRGTLEVPTTLLISDSGMGDATAGLDYTFSNPQTITIPAGTYDGSAATAIAIPTLQILDDAAVERDETIELMLSQPSTNTEIKDANADGVIFTQHTYTIVNDDFCTDDSQCPVGLGICNLTQNPTQCEPEHTCGNSKIETGEFCDDGNLELADGCDADCKFEEGRACVENTGCSSGICDQSNAIAICEPVDTCGNNVVEGDEICDDGNLSAGDGCDVDCKLEDNVECDDDALCASGICDQSTNPGRCEAQNTCGNTIVEDGETCDDGGTIIGDGCDSDCRIENALNCVGDRNCPEGQKCLDSLCDVECRSDIDCVGDCVLGECVDCAKDEDCNQGYQCQSKHCVTDCASEDDCSPSGFCDEKCVECLENTDCLDGEVCADGVCDDPNRCDPNQANCYRSCESNSDCEDPRIPYCAKGSCGECEKGQDCLNDEICAVVEGIHICQPACTVDSCAEGVCGQEGVCVDCNNNADCDRGRCDVAGHVCVSDCEADGDCVDPSLKKCDTDAQLCVAECTSDEDCLEGKCSLETHRCEPNREVKEADLDGDAGCGCAARRSRFPLTPLMFFVFIAFLGAGRRRKGARGSRA